MTTPPLIQRSAFTSTQRAVLNHDLENIPAADLRLILKDICRKNEDLAQALYRSLRLEIHFHMPAISPTHVAAPCETTIVDLTQTSDPEQEKTSPTSRKRKTVADQAVASQTPKKSKTGPNHDPDARCANCGELLTGSDANEAGECTYHDGELEPNYDAFPDHDEEIHGRIDCEEMRVEFPDRFNWDCCDGTSKVDGCKKGRHVDWSGLLEEATVYAQRRMDELGV
ncbi:hypothetical protein OHC33_007681 [Knufia fluminis]|uniref:Uncharacterized protein n=1 Tax=Knufia fluminis TaxID=191047 RepID=A0AAN8EGX9_9EURO|nr:hypothetical protein OHC33_007681 [Knufia fluminis]